MARRSLPTTLRLANRESKLLAGSIVRVAVKQDQTRAVRLPRSVRRAQLLDAALEVFTSQGYHSAAMDDIAERAGVSKPVLYQHFPSKLDLYLALLDSGAEDLIAKIKEALDSTRDNRKRVTAAVAVYFSFVDDSAEAFRLLFETDLLTRSRCENGSSGQMTNAPRSCEKSSLKTPDSVPRNPQCSPSA